MNVYQSVFLDCVFLDSGFELSWLNGLSFVVGRQPDNQISMFCSNCAWKNNLQVAVQMDLVIAMFVDS